jgi:protein-tyrosine phosphatase
MVEAFVIATVSLRGGGRVGLCRLPGRGGDLANDVVEIRKWQASLVVSLTEIEEMEKLGAKDLATLLVQQKIDWRHFPIVDYGVPTEKVDAEWRVLSQELHQALSAGENILLHCHGGLGRSGMIALRLMIECGEAPEAALARLRSVRPGAVETEAQLAWSSASAV